MRNERIQKNPSWLGTRVAKILKMFQQAMFDNSLQVPFLNDLMYMGMSENVVYPEKTNGFADHYPY